MAEMSKSPEEIKNFETKKELAYIAFGKVTYEGCHKIAAKALAYIQRLEIRNGAIEKELDEALVLNDKQATIIRSLNSNNSQVRKALQDNGFQTLEELLQAYNQVKRERDAAVRDIKRLVVLKLKKVCLLCANRNKPICNQCEGLDVFEWRGVPEKEEEHE